MLTMPELDEQAMYDFETYFHLSMTLDRVAKMAVHFEAFKMVQDVPGSIVECGVFKGTSFSRFAMLRQLLGSSFSCPLIGFDVFDDDYPTTGFEEDHAQRQHWIETAGGSSISVDQLSTVLRDRGVDNFQLVAGDVCETVPDYVARNPGLRISLLNVDIDFVEPTLCVLEHLYDRVCRGGVVLFDNYAGEGTSGLTLHGDTKAIDDFLRDRGARVRRFPYAARPCYLVKD